MKKTKNMEVEVVSSSQNVNLISNVTPEQLISQGIQSGMSVEILERLLAMRDKLNKEVAVKQFNEAMANFQMECPIISKNKKVMNKDKVTVRYSYATIDHIVSQVGNIIAKNGLSYDFGTVIDGDEVKVVCTITHILGHTKSSGFKVPTDKESFMNNQQRFASALTYAKRYAFCNALGIMTGDEDDDSNSNTESEKKVKEDKTNYIDLLKVVLYKKGAKTLESSLEIYNTVTGLNLKEFPNNNEEAKKLYQTWINSPLNTK